MDNKIIKAIQEARAMAHPPHPGMKDQDFKEIKAYQAALTNLESILKREEEKEEAIKLPKELLAPCCTRKPLHGNIKIYLDKMEYQNKAQYCYKRKSNGDPYTRLMSKQELLNWVKNILPKLIKHSENKLKDI